MVQTPTDRELGLFLNPEEIDHSSLTAEQVTWYGIVVDYENDPKFHHLRRPGINLVPGRGSLDPHGIFFVGEAPGENENIKRIPFVGRAGQIWEDLLEDVLELTRDNVYVTNLVKYRPLGPANRDPSPHEIVSSIPYLTREINLLNPKVIVPLGRIATQAFYPDKPVKAVRGKVNDRRGRKVVPVYHPAATTYNEKLKLPLIEQFEVIRDLIS